VGEWFRAGDFTEPLPGEVRGLSDQTVRRYLFRDPAFARALADRGLAVETRPGKTGRPPANEYRLVRVAASAKAA
jgi:hypothetical protein